MSFFRQPKPRRFHHEPIYYDEHRDRVNKIMERARKELEDKPEKKFNPEDIRGAFTGSVRQKRQSHSKGLLGAVGHNVGAIVVIIIVLLLVWLYLEQ